MHEFNYSILILQLFSAVWMQQKGLLAPPAGGQGESNLTTVLTRVRLDYRYLSLSIYIYICVSKNK